MKESINGKSNQPPMGTSPQYKGIVLCIMVVEAAMMLWSSSALERDHPLRIGSAVLVVLTIVALLFLGRKRKAE